MHRVSSRLILASAQLAIAREYGFVSWPALKVEVIRREVFNRRDLRRLARLLEQDQAVAVRRMEHWCDHPGGVPPLGYVAMCASTRAVWICRRSDLARVRSRER